MYVGKIHIMFSTFAVTFESLERIDFLGLMHGVFSEYCLLLKGQILTYNMGQSIMDLHFNLILNERNKKKQEKGSGNKKYKLF